MKRIIPILAMLLAVLVATPVSASSLGISPTGPLELNVPSNGEGTLDFTVIGVTGNLHIDLEDIPLSLTPSNVSVVNGQVVAVTIHGNGTNNIYEGKIRFLATSGDNVAVGIKVRLTVNVGLAIVIPILPTFPSGGGGGGGVAQPSTTASSDGKVSLSIPSSTVMRTATGQQIYNLSVTPVTNPPPVPQNTSIVGLTYDFEPSGTTFTPPITLTFKYSESDIPKGVDENSLTVAYYDEKAGKWIELESQVDISANIVTAKVAHFTTFVVIGNKTQVALPVLPSPKPVPPPVVTPIPTLPEVVPTPPVVSPTPEQPLVTPILPSSNFRGWGIACAVVLVVIVGFVGYKIWVRRRI